MKKLLPVLLASAVLSMTVGCQFLKTPGGQTFVEGRAKTAAYVIATENPDVIGDLFTASNIVSALATSTDTISIGALTFALEEAGLESQYAPVIVSEIVALYELAMSQTDIAENEIYVVSKTTLASIANGLRQGISEYNIYVGTD